MYRNQIPQNWKDNLPGWTIIPLKDSNARDFLASERTYLSWIRTSITAIALGAAIAKFFDRKEKTYRIIVLVIGTTLVVSGIVITVYSFFRHHYMIKEFLNQQISVDSFGPTFMATILIVVAILILVVLFM